VTEAVPRGLVPPRPNLGPEPWTDDPPIMAVVVATVAVASLLSAWLLWRLFRRRRARAARPSVIGGNPPDDTPRGQILALSDSIREALIRQFGTAWRAKTTEELAEDSQLEQALGQEPLEELIRFLDRVDLLKFAPERSNARDGSLERELLTWKPRVGNLLDTIRAKANGRVKNQDANPRMPRSPS
jgi:hypothetical protein